VAVPDGLRPGGPLVKAWLRHGRDATPNRGQPRLARHAGHLSWTMRCTSSSRPVTVSFARRC